MKSTRKNYAVNEEMLDLQKISERSPPNMTVILGPKHPRSFLDRKLLLVEPLSVTIPPRWPHRRLKTSRESRHDKKRQANKQAIIEAEQKMNQRNTLEQRDDSMSTPLSLKDKGERRRGCSGLGEIEIV